MKLYTLSVLYKGHGGQVKKLSAAYELSSFGFFQKKRFVVIIDIEYIYSI